ncbi:MAG: ASKHA domain-containing protein [Puniceicoccaceae bacterium]
MGATKFEVIIPGGQRRSVRLPEDAQHLTFAEALEAQGLPLNMRCGGRGLCRGCTVEFRDGDSIESFRACQRKTAKLPSSATNLFIPENSWRDHSLHGVSVFEIHTSADLQSSHRSGFGLALDIGTTTIAGALWDFSNNHCLAHHSRPNPQARYGDNVVSRIHYSMERESGSADLQRSLVKDGLQPMLRALCAQGGVNPGSIVSATASGNPTMLHTLAGESLDGLAKYPFKPNFLGQRTFQAIDVGFKEDFELVLLPGLGPFVGADVAVGALASGMLEEEGPILLIDFGTNGEILLKTADGYLATATAAGPAFEGGRLACGAAARAGVISSLRRREGQWHWKLSRSGEEAPVGISGAAYVDFLAAGANDGLLDHFGRFNRQSTEVHQRKDGEDADWAIAISEKTYITEADVAELLQAKAAIGGGVLTLMEKAGIEASDLRKVLVAGGFGYHLDPAHAMRVGLLPEVPLERIDIVGNASLGGACLLLNDGVSKQLQPLLGQCEVVELNQEASFEDHFTDCLLLEQMDL